MPSVVLKELGRFHLSVTALAPLHVPVAGVSGQFRSPATPRQLEISEMIPNIQLHQTNGESDSRETHEKK